MSHSAEGGSCIAWNPTADTYDGHWLLGAYFEGLWVGRDGCWLGEQAALA